MAKESLNLNVDSTVDVSHVPSIPLSFLRNGESGKVVRISGKCEVKRFLEGLGFIPGTSIRMVNLDKSGRILEVMGSRIAIDEGMAAKIMVTQ